MKKAIVVGASSGIGKAIALQLLNHGWKVGITGRREKLLQEIAASYPEQAVYQLIDNTGNDVYSELDQLTSQLGGLDLFVLSSGTGELNESLDPDLEAQTVALNVNAFTTVIGWAYRYLEAQGYGQLAAITSVGGLRGSRIAPAYNASKAYQLNYLEGLRAKARKSGVPLVISDLRPGLVDTAMAKGEGLFWVAPVEKAGKQAFRALQRKRPKTYITRRWQLIALLLKSLPARLYTRM